MKHTIRKQLSLVIGIAALVSFVRPASADFIPLPVKWSQPIVYDASGTVIIGKDRLSDHTAGVVRADDFVCDTPLPIVAVRWWGSYIGSTQIRPTSPGYVI